MALATGLGDVSGRIPVGEVLDRAARLLGASRNGVPLDDVTAGLLARRFDVVGNLLCAELPETSGTRTLLGRATPCVGRARELGTLRALIDECVEEPLARPVLITAAAGAGKSRIVHELVRGLDSSFKVWMAHGDPVSAGSSFAMLSRVLRAGFDIREGDPVGVRRGKLRERLGSIALADADRVRRVVDRYLRRPTEAADRTGHLDRLPQVVAFGCRRKRAQQAHHQRHGQILRRRPEVQPHDVAVALCGHDLAFNQLPFADEETRHTGVDAGLGRSREAGPGQRHDQAQSREGCAD
jgi:hypothetical protein